MNCEQIMQQLEFSAARLRSTRNEVESVSLFGASAKADYDFEAGADVLIILLSDGRKWEERVPEYQGYFSGVSIPLDVFPLTHEEIQRAQKSKDGFLGPMLDYRREIGINYDEK